MANPPGTESLPEALKVDLGCGDRKPAGFIGVDCVPGPQVDMVADLTGRFPFEDDSVGHLRAHDAIEHWPDRLHTMNEIWRVCRHGAVVDIRVPSTDGRGAFQDPTHVSYWNSNSFFYYAEEHPAYLELCRKYGFKGAFRIHKLENVASPDNVVHVHVVLEAVKERREAAPPPAPETLPRADLARHLAAQGGALQAFADGPYGARWRELLRANVPDEPLPPETAALCERLEAAFRDGIDGPAALAAQLAALLLKRPFDLPHRFAADRVPAALVEGYVSCFCRLPDPFTRTGDADRYADMVEAWTAHIHDGLQAHPDHPGWREAARQYTVQACVIGLYFNGRNLRTLYARRAAIIESTLRAHGFALDHAVPPRPAGRPIRVGVVLDMFHPKPEGFAALPVFEHLGPGFEVTLYALRTTGHRFEAYCRERAGALKALPEDPRAMVDMVRADELDVLFFAGNVTAVTSPLVLLAAHRVARVQMASVGSVTTTGFSAMDHYVSGRLTEPAPRPQDHYTEELLLLPDVAHCFSHGTEVATQTVRVSRAALGLGPEEVVLASVANVNKIIPELQEAWAEILARRPGTRLMLFPYGTHWASSYPKEVFVSSLRRTLGAHGVAGGRVVLVEQPNLNRDDIREFMKLADLYLDSFPFSGSTSIIEPLEASLPVVTVPGPAFRAAMASSLLTALGLEELVAADRADYVALACRLAGDAHARDALRGRIAAAMAATPPFLDPRLYGRRMADLFRRAVAARS